MDRDQQFLSMKRQLSLRKMLFNPSIIISLLLLLKLVASSDTLAHYFVPATDYSMLVGAILQVYHHSLPNVLTAEALRRNLKTDENAHVETTLKILDDKDLDRVLDVVLHPTCTRTMFKNLRKMIANLNNSRQSIVYAHIFIHQTWEKTKSVLVTADISIERHVFLRAAANLAIKAFNSKRFTLIRHIFKAVNPKHIRVRSSVS